MGDFAWISKMKMKFQDYIYSIATFHGVTIQTYYDFPSDYHISVEIFSSMHSKIVTCLCLFIGHVSSRISIDFTANWPVAWWVLLLYHKREKWNPLRWKRFSWNGNVTDCHCETERDTGTGTPNGRLQFLRHRPALWSQVLTLVYQPTYLIPTNFQKVFWWDFKTKAINIWGAGMGCHTMRYFYSNIKTMWYCTCATQEAVRQFLVHIYFYRQLFDSTRNPETTKDVLGEENPDST